MCLRNVSALLPPYVTHPLHSVWGATFETLCLLCCWWNFKALVDSDQMAALSGTVEFSYRMNIRVHPLNLHKTFKNIFKWHPGKYCWHHRHTALGIFFPLWLLWQQRLLPVFLCPGAFSGFQKLLCLSRLSESHMQSMENKHPSFFTSDLRLPRVPK